MIILVAGEKGGTGKTTIATNLATMLASRDREVLLLDEVNLAIPCPNNDCHPDQNGICLPSQHVENI